MQEQAQEQEPGAGARAGARAGVGVGDDNGLIALSICIEAIESIKWLPPQLRFVFLLIEKAEQRVIVKKSNVVVLGTAKTRITTLPQ